MNDNLEFIVRLLTAEIENKSGKSELDKEGYPNLPDHVLKFRNQVDLESDRGAALYASSFLEFELEQLLTKYFVQNEKLKEKLFDFNGPLGTFLAKIVICYSLGLISKDMMDDMNIIRKIRNDFAHNHESISFNDNPISSKCISLKFNIVNDKIEGRRKFIRVVMSIHAILIVQISNIKSIEEELKFNLGSAEIEKAKTLIQDL